jgi:hypothetical protein
MKNLKKLNRKDMKTISGNGLLDDITGALDFLDPLVKPIANTLNNVFCRIECVSNGTIVIKFLPCESSC